MMHLMVLVKNDRIIIYINKPTNSVIGAPWKLVDGSADALAMVNWNQDRTGSDK